MQIYVKLMSWKCIPLEVEPTDRIEDIKAKIQDREGIPIDQQRLILPLLGKELRNEFTLQEYSIFKDSTIQMVINNKPIQNENEKEIVE